MKKVFLLLMVAACLLFAGCGEESSSIGIIGGADGPTSIYVSE